MSALELVPVTQREAAEWIRRHHRHHLPPRGDLCRVAVARSGEVVGIGTAGRPVARHYQDGWTVEVTRVCTLDGQEAEHAASMIYAALWRAARALGYRRCITYTLVTEAGTSLRAAGWKVLHEVRGRSWSC